MNKEELEKEFEKYLKDSSDYYDPREPLTERKLLQMWLDCAEPREKQIEELEYQLTHRNCLDCSNHSSNLRMRNLDLEKENAELKGEADSVLDNWCKGNDPCPHLKKRDEQLAKAKEIIRELLTCARNYPESNKQKMQKAEQFLNSEMKMTEDDFLERVDNGFN